MADRFFGIAIGGMQPKDVTEGAATGGAGAPVELRINDTVYANKIQVIQGLEAIANYLKTTEGNPIG